MCPDQWNCTYCGPDDDYGDHYFVVLYPEDIDLDMEDPIDLQPIFYVGREAGFALEMHVRYWSRCPGVSSTFEVRVAPREWRTRAEALPHKEGQYGAMMWKSYNGFEYLTGKKVIYARRAAPQCADPLPADEPEMVNERVVINDVVVPDDARHSIDKLALPPNPYADVVRLSLDFSTGPRANDGSKDEL